MSRRIAHLDIDAFYASVELQRRPELRGLPVIVAGSGPRAVVTTASYEARRFGIGSAMPASRARRLCPEAVVVAPDFTAYRAVSQTVMALVRGQVDRVEVVGLDEAYLDLSGLVAPRAAMRRLVEEVRGATGLSVSVGIGPNKLVAKVASDAEKPGGFVVLSREEACARFASASPALVPGIGPKTVARLAAMGITTLGALAGVGDDVLAERFGGRQGPWLRRRAAFEDDAQVTLRADRRVRVARDDVRHRHRRARGRWRTRCAGWPASCAPAWRATTAAAARSRSRSAWPTSRRSRGRARSRRPRTTARRSRSWPSRCCASTHPPRPVRLLGVRVASFEHEQPPHAAGAASDQLELEV